MVTQIIATRMELLRLKKKGKLAQKGHKLLKEKRDALIGEFFSLVDSLKMLRRNVEGELSGAYRSLIIAQAVGGYQDVKLAAEAQEVLPPLDVDQKTIMGVKVPLFSLAGKVTSTYSVVGAPLELDIATEKFSGVLQSLIKLAQEEEAVRRLAEEIKKTKRKVNALEQILIPRLEKDIVYIRVRLEEMERENFSRLKIIKKRM